MHESSIKETDLEVTARICPSCGNETIFYTKNTLKSIKCGFCFLEELWFPSNKENKNDDM